MRIAQIARTINVSVTPDKTTRLAVGAPVAVRAGRYEYQRELGRGADGRVIQVADHAAAGALRAIKSVSAQSEERVRWEFALLCRIAHPNLARVHELLRVDAAAGLPLPVGSLALVSELAVGSRADELARVYAADKAKLLQLCGLVLDRVARALSAIHAHGFVHADVKPQNIIVADDLSDATLIDLGLARSAGLVREAFGTPGYIAPELWRGELGPAVDLYALGVTACHLLAPARARDGSGSTQDEMARTLAASAQLPPLPGWVPPALAQLLADLCAVSPAQRPVSARDLARQLQELGILPERERGPAGAQTVVARGDAERALQVTSLALVGHADALASLQRALGTSGVTCVLGAPGSGRSRLVREAVGALQLAAAVGGGSAPSYRVEDELPALAPDYPCILHLQQGDDTPLEQALATVRAAQVAGRFCHVVLERSAQPPGVAQTIRLSPMSEREIEQLLQLALQLPVKGPLLREALAVSGGLGGRLCRVLCAGLAAGDDMTRVGQLRTHAAGLVGDRPKLPERAELLAQLLSVCGGSLTQEAAEAVLATPAEMAQDARALLALGACSLGSRSELTLRPDFCAALWAELGPQRRAELAARVPQTRLDPRARAFVLCAKGDAQRAAAAFVVEIKARMQAGEPELALALASDARTVLAAQAGVNLLLAQAEALRALGRYEPALALLAAANDPESAVARAELLRLRGQSAQAQSAARQVLSSAPDGSALAAAAALIVARLALDAGRVHEALAGASCVVQRDDSVGLRACELLALAQLQLGETQAAQTGAAQALLRARAVGDRVAEARLLAVLGFAHRAEGDLHRAGIDFARAFELAQAAGEFHAAASFLVNLGTSRLDAGELGPALDACREGARRLARLGRERDLARVLYNLAFAAHLTGDDTAALAALGEAQRSAQAASDVSANAFCGVLLAEIHAERAEHEQALACLSALPDPATVPAPERAGTFARAAVVAVELQDAARAERYLQIADAVGDPTDAEQELAHAALARQRGDVRGAFEAATRALGHAQGRGEFGVRLIALLSAARAAEGVGDAALARQHFAELRSMLDAAALTLLPPERARLRQVRAYRAALAALPVPSQSTPADDRWRKLAALTKRFTSEHRLSRLHEIVLDAAIDLSGAERGYLLWNDADGTPRVRAGRGLDRAQVEADAVSRSIVSRVISARTALSTVDAREDVRLSGVASVHSLSLRSVLAVPILSQGDVRGVIYLDDRLRPFAFGDTELALLSDLGDLAAIALESAERLRRERRTSRRLQVARERLSRQVQAQAIELESWQRGAHNAEAYPGIVAHSASMQQLLALATRLGKSDVPVLVRGESGTGKELIARVIHEQSPRKARPLVSENCGAIPETLLESALFGHVRGAFTGADKRRLGLFEVADGGTLFLDEIGEMSAAMQSRLLRVLQDGEVRPVGSERILHVDVRLIAATHRDLEAMVKAGSFREDLYYRLSVVPLVVPPLRERIEDVAPLVAHFVHKHAPGRKVRVDRRALEVLCAQSWPGNVRQLENEVRRALVLASDVIREEHWSFGASTAAVGGGVAELDLRGHVDELERRLIRRALDSAKGNQTKAARLLGVSRFGLQKMQKRLGTPR